ncbi:hypothetical protein NC997_00955 [Trichocoleus sp. DQ-A2]|nr:hypothetical protein [Coleofasciculus sp. FACHB-T130]
MRLVVEGMNGSDRALRRVGMRHIAFCVAHYTYLPFTSDSVAISLT